MCYPPISLSSFFLSPPLPHLFFFCHFFLEHCLKEWISAVRVRVDVVMFIAPIAWWLLYGVCVLASVMPWCLRCDAVIWGGQGHGYIAYMYPTRGVKCTYKSYKSYKCWVPGVWDRGSHPPSKCSWGASAQPGMKWLRVACKPNSLSRWPALQDIM